MNPDSRSRKKPLGQTKRETRKASSFSMVPLFEINLALLSLSHHLCFPLLPQLVLCRDTVAIATDGGVRVAAAARIQRDAVEHAAVLLDAVAVLRVDAVLALLGLLGGRLPGEVVAA